MSDDKKSGLIFDLGVSFILMSIVTLISYALLRGGIIFASITVFFGIIGTLLVVAGVYLREVKK